MARCAPAFGSDLGRKQAGVYLDDEDSTAQNLDSVLEHDLASRSQGDMPRGFDAEVGTHSQGDTGLEHLGAPDAQVVYPVDVLRTATHDVDSSRLKRRRWFEYRRLVAEDDQ